VLVASLPHVPSLRYATLNVLITPLRCATILATLVQYCTHYIRCAHILLYRRYAPHSVLRTALRYRSLLALSLRSIAMSLASSLNKSRERVRSAGERASDLCCSLTTFALNVRSLTISLRSMFARYITPLVPRCA
jgi:hypothetical protein